MTVLELINQLKKFEDSLEVVLHWEDYVFKAPETIELNKNNRTPVVVIS